VRFLQVAIARQRKIQWFAIVAARREILKRKDGG
jgi:hypothetical protein